MYHMRMHALMRGSACDQRQRFPHSSPQWLAVAETPVSVPKRFYENAGSVGDLVHVQMDRRCARLFRWKQKLTCIGGRNFSIPLLIQWQLCEYTCLWNKAECTAPLRVGTDGADVMILGCLYTWHQHHCEPRYSPSVFFALLTHTHVPRCAAVT